MSKRVLIVVTHLLGAGHLTRATALARAFAEAGHAVTLVSGGMPTLLPAPDNVAFVQLPPVQIRGTDFRKLLDEQGTPITAKVAEARGAILHETIGRAQPDVLITELFPFGRRVLAEEFLAVLHQAHAMRPRPLVLSSIRDILVAPKRERIAETAARIDEFYDAVLVHGDPALAPLDLSWPVDETFRKIIHYTGYVDEEAAAPEQVDRAGIVVSGGSSAASLPLYRAALEAARIVAHKNWHILIGRGIDDVAFETLSRAAPAHAKVERARPDFRRLLAAAELSISQAGYNTCVDLLRSGPRAILVPFELDRETEQRLRAESLQRNGLAQILPETRLTGHALAASVAFALEEPLPPRSSVAVNGAQETVRIADALAVARPALLPTPVDWSEVNDALAISRDSGREPVLWWRDDDAVRATPQFNRLLQLAARFEAAIAIAVVPSRAEPDLAERLLDEDRASILVHGYSHLNHAPAGQKKAEFGPGRDNAVMAVEAGRGLQDLSRYFDDRLLPVFVPPWNRIAPELVPRLTLAGYTGLSTFRDRPVAQPVPGLTQINTHVDPIDWRGGRSLADIRTLTAALANAIRSRVGDAAPEPVGFLTHHQVHDEAIWRFCEEFLDFMARKNLRFRAGSKVIL